MAFDPDEFVKNESAAPVNIPAAATATDTFDPDAFLASEQAAPTVAPQIQPPEPTAVAVPGTDYQIPFQAPVVNPAGLGVMGQLAQTPVGQAATNVMQNVGRVTAPYRTAASKTLGAYVANPMAKLAPDLAAVSMGVPPPYATSQAIGATQGAVNVARNLPTAQPSAPPTGPPTPAQVQGNPMLSEMARREAAAASTTAAEASANRSIIQKLAMNKVMQMAAPAVNTAARVAGPAGLAYNMYEAGQTARQTGLGERLAQGQGKRAEQAFRQMNVPYGAGFNQGITQQQAQNILASGSPRDIQAFGGTELLRKKALGL